MSEWNKDDAALDADLARLRKALADLQMPADEEERLRAAFRARAAAPPGAHAAAAGARRSSDVSPRGRLRVSYRPRAIFAAGALAASIAVTAAVLVGLGRSNRDGAESAAIVPATTAGESLARGGASGGASEMPAVAGFQPLLYSPGISSAQAYNVVRVRIPLSSLVGYGVPPDGTIEADVLIGEDGLARGIRFDTTNTQLVSMASQ